MSICNGTRSDVITLSSSSKNVSLDTKDISWKSDRQKKFRQVHGFQKALNTGKPCNETLTNVFPASNCKSTYYQGQHWYFAYPDDENIQYLYESYPQVVNPIEGVANEHFIVWMRTAGLSNFRKLYGRIHSDFDKGDTITFRISNNFEVNSFDGTKSIVISTLGQFGGKNSFLGVSYIVVGAVSIMLAIVFILKAQYFPRELGDT
eukprot:gene2939-3599_t